MEVVSQIFWMSKFGRDALEKELRKRFEKLIESIQPREFHHAGEGLKVIRHEEIQRIYVV